MTTRSRTLDPAFRKGSLSDNDSSFNEDCNRQPRPAVAHVFAQPRQFEPTSPSLAWLPAR